MRKKFTVFVFSLGCALLNTVNSAKAIINGQPAGELIRHTLMVLDDHGHVCSGVVIARSSILTAAHCVTKAGAWRVHWRAPDNAIMLVEPKSIRIHPGYDANAVKNRSRSIDLAVITLSEPLPSSFEPINLSNAANIQAGDIMTVAGFGLTDEKNRKSLGKLNRVDLSVVEPNGHSTILVWLADPASNGMGGCHGDSGGPMLYQNALIAITTWTTGEGKRDCGALTQGVLIAPQRDWIMKAIEP
jgi:secreted trypsin-like serine protease